MSHVQAYVMTDPAGMSTIKTIFMSSTVIGWWKRCDWGWKGMHNGVLCTHLKNAKNNACSAGYLGTVGSP